MLKLQALKQSFAIFMTLMAFTPEAARAAGSSDHVMPGTTYFAVAEQAAAGDQPISGAFGQAFGNLAPRFPNTNTVFNTLRWWNAQSAPPVPTERYVRMTHFGGWMDKPTDNTCLNTRGLVLLRDSRRQVTTAATAPCFIETGLWYDPYTNQNYEKAADVQIDHVVALKNAYISGAYRWDWRTRCAYANFMGNRFHLLAVQGSANTMKSDLSVAGYLPPNIGYRCEFIANVLRIKLIWRLWISEPEAQAIAATVRALNCDPRQFQFPTAELERQRQLIAAGRNECPATPPPPPPPSAPTAPESVRPFTDLM